MCVRERERGGRESERRREEERDRHREKERKGREIKCEVDSNLPSPSFRQDDHSVEFDS